MSVIIGWCLPLMIHLFTIAHWDVWLCELRKPFFKRLDVLWCQRNKYDGGAVSHIPAVGKNTHTHCLEEIPWGKLQLFFNISLVSCLYVILKPCYYWYDWPNSPTVNKRLLQMCLGSVLYWVLNEKSSAFQPTCKMFVSVMQVWSKHTDPVHGLLPQEGQPHPLPAGRALSVVQGPPPGAQDRPPQDVPQVPVLPLHRHQGFWAELVGHGPGRAQGLRWADAHCHV